MNRLTPEQIARWQRPEVIRRLLLESHTIAIVGLSTDEQKASSFVATYLMRAGYRVIPVTPKGGQILGEVAYPDLASVPEKVDIVDVFRRGKDCPAVAQQAIAIGAKALWIQLGIVSVEAAELAEQAGVAVVMDRCMKMEHGRLAGSLHWAGMDTGMLTARKGRIGLA